jgi:hypothetical protein
MPPIDLTRRRPVTTITPASAVGGIFASALSRAPSNAWTASIFFIAFFIAGF